MNSVEKTDLWCLVGMLLAMLLVIALAPSDKLPQNQSQAWHGHTGSDYHVPWIVPPKGTWDQTTKTSIK